MLDSNLGTRMDSTKVTVTQGHIRFSVSQGSFHETRPPSLFPSRLKYLEMHDPVLIPHKGNVYLLTVYKKIKIKKEETNL